MRTIFTSLIIKFLMSVFLYRALHRPWSITYAFSTTTRTLRMRLLKKRCCGSFVLSSYVLRSQANLRKVLSPTVTRDTIPKPFNSMCLSGIESPIEISLNKDLWRVNWCINSNIKETFIKSNKSHIWYVIFDVLSQAPTHGKTWL